MASDCMECVEGRAVALGLCADCLAGEPVEAVVRQIARLTRELEEARAVLEDVRDALEVLPPGILGEASEVETAHDGEVGVRSWMIRDELIDRINRALSTPQEAGGADCRCAPAAPWRSDGATCPDWPGCGNPDWRPATPQEAGGAD